MTTLTAPTGGIKNAAGDLAAGTLTVWALEPRESKDGTGLIDTRRHQITITAGTFGSVTLDPGPVNIVLATTGTSKTFRGVTVPDQASVSLDDLLAGSFEYVPAVQSSVHADRVAAETARDQSIAAAATSGKDAYQIAVDNGFVGTESAWLASLASTIPGPTGPAGPTGPQGPAGTGGTSDWSSITGKPSTFPPDTHTHTSANISDSTTVGRSVVTAADAAAARAAIGAGTSNLALGITGTTAAAGNDARLSDARTPTTHTHGVTDLTATGTKDASTFLRGDNTWATPAGNIPIRFSAATAITGVTGTDRAPAARTLTGARMRVAAAPAGSALTVQVQHWNGSAWSDIGTALSIAAGSTTEATATFSQAQVAGNLVRLNVTSVGSTTAATGVVIDVEWA